MTQKYELALRKTNIMEEELKNERLNCKDYKKLINEISEEIEENDLQLKKAEQKILNDETILRKRQERENKDEYFQKQKGIERSRSRKYDSEGKKIDYESTKIETQTDVNISEQSNKSKIEREKFFSLNPSENQNDGSFKFNKNSQENKSHIFDRKDSFPKKNDAEVVGQEDGIEALMSDDDEDERMEVDRESIPANNLLNNFQGSVSGMKQHSEVITNRGKKENTHESSSYYNRQNSLKKTVTGDNSDVKSIKVDNTNYDKY